MTGDRYVEIRVLPPEVAEAELARVARDLAASRVKLGLVPNPKAGPQAGRLQCGCLASAAIVDEAGVDVCGACSSR